MTSAITAMPPIVNRLPLRLVIVAFLSIMAVFAFALFQAFQAERWVRAETAQTTRIVLDLQQALQTGVDAETGQRGFLLTGDPDYLEGYRIASATWLDQIAAITAFFAAAEPGQVAAAGELTRLATDKLDEMTRTIVLVQEGNLQGAIAIVQSGQGKALFDDYRAVSSRLADEERALLAVQVEVTQAIERRTFAMLGVLTVMGAALTTLSLWLERRTTAAERSAADVTALRAAVGRSDLLAREMDHRVKNLFSVIGAMVSHTGRTETDLKPAMEGLRGRINALSVAHAVSQGGIGDRFANLGAVVEATLAPFHVGDGRVSVTGPTLDLPVRVLSSLGLILYELATNAVKYGALSSEAGQVRIAWDVADGTVTLHWRETGSPVQAPAPDATPAPAPAPAPTEGFGSMMLRQAAMQIDGTLDRTVAAGGVDVTLAFPAAPKTVA